MARTERQLVGKLIEQLTKSKPQNSAQTINAQCNIAPLVLRPSGPSCPLVFLFLVPKCSNYNGIESLKTKPRPGGWHAPRLVSSLSHHDQCFPAKCDSEIPNSQVPGCIVISSGIVRWNLLLICSSAINGIRGRACGRDWDWDRDTTENKGIWISASQLEILPGCCPRIPHTTLTMTNCQKVP